MGSAALFICLYVWAVDKAQRGDGGAEGRK